MFDDVRKEDKWNEELQDHEEKLKEDERWGSIFEMDSLKVLVEESYTQQGMRKRI